MHPRPHTLPPAARAALLALGTLSLLGAAGLPSEEGKPAGKTVLTRVVEDNRKREVTLKGDVKLDAAAPQPVTVSGDGSFIVKEEQAGKVRRYVATAEKRSYTVGGQEQPLDAEAEAWLREVIRGVAKNNPEGGKGRVIEVHRQHLEGAPGHAGHPAPGGPEGRKVRVEVLKGTGDGPATVFIHREGNGGETVEKHLKIVTEGDGPEGCGDCGPMGHAAMGHPPMGHPGMGHHPGMGPHPGLGLPWGPPPVGPRAPGHLPPDHAVLQAEVAALQAELKLLQARLNQLQKALSAAPKETKGGTPMPPPPPPPHPALALRRRPPRPAPPLRFHRQLLQRRL